jgi:hypothetical protein
MHTNSWSANDNFHCRGVEEGITLFSICTGFRGMAGPANARERGGGVGAGKTAFSKEGRSYSRKGRRWGIGKC